ncbi:MAG: hypothetical protein JWM81_148 [Candidatus Saccharibacteria bacterium]|nr:hypothetical protein [Candidatus Saccharibacteria bacterium]
MSITPEQSPDQAQASEYLAPEELGELCSMLTEEGSQRFRSGDLLSIETGFECVDKRGTSYSYGIRADRLAKEDLGTFITMYELGLSVCQTIDFVNDELRQIMLEENGEILPDQAVDEVCIDYNIRVNLSSDGSVGWRETRTYAVAMASPETGDVEVDDDEDAPGPEAEAVLYTEFQKQLGYQCIAEVVDELGVQGAPERESLPTTESSDQTLKDFWDMMVEAGISESFVTAERNQYLAKAYAVFNAILCKNDAVFDRSNYFPPDVVAYIEGEA